MSNKIIKIIKNPKMIIKYLMDKNFFFFLGDKAYLKLRYKLITGKKLNLENPKTYNEKLQWLKLNDRNPEYTKMVDKYEVKKYVANIIGEEYIIPTLGIWDKFEDIEFDKLPNQFVLKCTHDSGGIIICKDKNKLDIEKARKKINKCLKNNFYYHAREWPYKNIKPRIIAEQYMVDESGTEIKDYKFFCFNGKAKVILVCSNRFVKLKETFLDENWNIIDVVEGGHEREEKIEKPFNHSEMVKLSERLAQNIDFVRIDFYEINKKVYFGEITFYPASGIERFKPEEYDMKLGDMLKLTKKEIKEKNER